MRKAPSPEAMWSVDVQCRRNGGPRGPGARPPGTFHADRPDTSTYMGPIFLLEQSDMFIRFQNKANISYPVGGPGGQKVQTKNPHASAKNIKWGNQPVQRQCGVLMCNVGEMEGQRAPEAGRSASPGPPAYVFKRQS